MDPASESPALFEAHIDNLNLLGRGKVRDIYTIDETHLLMIATDRLSAFDVVFSRPVPQKGELLTSLSHFWFNRCAGIVANHLSDLNLQDYVSSQDYQRLKSRAMIVKRLNTLPIEAIVRGYVIGSGWKDYQSSGQICGIPLPKGLQQGQILPEPIFTPSTKSAVGDHDVNVSFEAVVDLIGESRALQVKKLSIQLYTQAAKYALERGIIIADTKFEFGVDTAGELILIDEILTPDSSRFWAVNRYEVGISPPSFDKQIIRDYLETLDWDKTAPAPEIPHRLIEKMRQQYQALYRLLTKPVRG